MPQISRRSQGGRGLACEAGDRALDWIGLQIASCMHHGRRAMEWMRYDAAKADKGGYDRKAGHFPQYTDNNGNAKPLIEHARSLQAKHAAVADDPLSIAHSSIHLASATRSIDLHAAATAESSPPIPSHAFHPILWTLVRNASRC